MPQPDPPVESQLRFLSGPIIHTGSGNAETSVLLDTRHQGWSNRPHGGILMSMVLELAHAGFEPPLITIDHFPFTLSCRWGGPAISLGREIIIHALAEEHLIQGNIRADKKAAPSLTMNIHSGKSISDAEAGALDKHALIMKNMGKKTKDRITELPYSDHCFVCGTKRNDPGLERKFYCLEQNEGSIVYTVLGLDQEDQDCISRFLFEGNQVHPGALAAILDETLGWSGFIRTRHGGMTVKLEIDLLRPVEQQEKLLFYGLCTGTRGSNPNRLFWYAEGGILPILTEKPSPVMLARGQWLAIADLTEEMKQQLSPRQWLDRWFE